MASSRFLQLPECFSGCNFKMKKMPAKNNKQLLNSVLTDYEELLRERFMLSAEGRGLNNSSYLREPTSIIVLLFICKYFFQDW